MNVKKPPARRRLPLSGRANIKVLAVVLAFFCLRVCGWSQGTMTVRFEGPPAVPPGTDLLVSNYSESGVRFWYPDPPTSAVGLVLVGAGNAGGSPNNGTTHLETFAGSYVTFSLSPIALFNLISFDATESYNTTPGAETLHVVGYKYYDMSTVAVDLTTDGTRQFQTFNLGPSFTGLGRVQITPSAWSGFALDNVVVGIPEPSAGMLILFGAVCGFGCHRLRRRRRSTPGT